MAYWTRVEAGTPGTFTFTNPAMNSHLFNPFRGSRATLETLKLLDPTDCDKAIIEGDVASMDAATLAKRQALKDAMCDATFKTDMVSNQPGMVEHVGKILDSAATAAVVTYEEGGKLVSEKLPLDVIVGAGADALLAANLSVETINAINALVVAAPGYAATATGCTEAQKLLHGGVSRADQVHVRVATLLRNLNVAGAEIDRAWLSFGVYGELPIVMVFFADANVAIDAVSGSLSGPFARGAQPGFGSLLTAHSEYAQTGWRVATHKGCISMVAIEPHGTPPAAPWAPAAPVAPSVTPGNPTKWVCDEFDALGGTVCRCTRTWTYVDPGPPARTLTVEERCSTPGACPNRHTPSATCTTKWWW